MLRFMLVLLFVFFFAREVWALWNAVEQKTNFYYAELVVVQPDFTFQAKKLLNIDKIHSYLLWN